MTRLSICSTGLLGLAVFFFVGGVYYASAAMNHGAGSLSDYCRSHCAPIATQSARNSCESGCLQHRATGKWWSGCVTVGADGCASAGPH
jgi:hypothetical protein